MVRGGHSDKVTFGQRAERNEGISHMDIWEERISSRGRSRCKCPEADSLLGLFENSKKANTAGSERVRGQ